MGKVDLAKYGSSGPKLNAAALDGADTFVGTVASVEDTKFTDTQTREEVTRMVIRFAEMPEHGYFPNVTSIRRLIDGLGDNSDRWKGKRVPLEVVKVPNPAQGGKVVEALWVVEADEWDSVLNPRRGRAATSKKKTAAKKRGRK